MLVSVCVLTCLAQTISYRHKIESKRNYVWCCCWNLFILHFIKF